MHNAIFNANASVGKNCIINTKVLIEHETTIKDCTHISTGSIINGQVTVDNNCFIGSNTVINNNIEIYDNIILSSGSQVYKNIVHSGIYIDTHLIKHK